MAGSSWGLAFRAWGFRVGVLGVDWFVQRRDSSVAAHSLEAAEVIANIGKLSLKP